MSTSGSYTHRDLLNAMDNLHRCLSDPSFEIQDAHRIKLTDKFYELKHQYHLLDHNNPSTMSDVTIDDSQPDSLAKKMSELLNIFNISSIAYPDQLDTKPISELGCDLLRSLLCFFLFGEAAEMKKKEVIYWWVGQGLIEDEDGKVAEEAADVILNKLIQAGAIEQVICSTSQKKSSKYRMTAIYNKLQQCEDPQKVGMLRKGETKLVLTDHIGQTLNEKSKECMERLEILFNPQVSILNISKDWLHKMRNLKVIHLGRWWNDDPEQHIEVEKMEFLEALKYLRQLRFISYKGISRIIELDDKICCLGDNLRVLDLQACPNLEKLPKEIGNLRNLTHLDLSECYLLDRIPKGITSLVKLQVLEGFVISDVRSSSSCKFKDLANYLGKNLIKLSIRTRKVGFPFEDDLKAFAKLVKLLKLKIVWIRISDSDDEEAPQIIQEVTTLKAKDGLYNSRSLVRTITNSLGLGEGDPYNSGLPEQLQKLEVQAIPQAAVQKLMFSNHQRLVNLKKLYVIGGEVSDLTDQGKARWDMVERLHLKHLTKLHMNWRHFMASFPRVTYLEKARCPNLSLFPCDHYGIWRKPEDL